MSDPRAHIASFHHASEWEPNRTSPCYATCACGWESETMRNQTEAEWVHGQHMATAGALPEDVLAEFRGGPLAHDDPLPEHDEAHCREVDACDDCLAAWEQEAAEAAADGRRDDG